MAKRIENIADLTPDPGNANQGTMRGAVQVEKPRAASIDSDAPGDQSAEGGAIPTVALQTTDTGAANG